MKKALIFLAEGFEEVEALTVVDLLRRAKISVDMVSISGAEQVTGSHGITVQADTTFEQCALNEADALILPGGMPGTRNLQAFAPLNDALKEADKQGKLLCAICAAPLVLGCNHILEGKKASCYPGFEEELLGATVSIDPVSCDGNVITSRGLGTAIDFGGEIIAALADRKTSDHVKESIIYQM